ncbi:hypothetical protein [Paenibacillus sp. GYB003]|uniref:hypothetical protein n=1 Tax=Paenibacillus sp. GYB003 TaxID=2994392 RepID=UPI002F96563A
MALLDQTTSRVKPSPQTGNLNDLQEYLKYLSNIVAMLAKNLDFIINGNLDANNIRANSIETKNLKAGAVTADKISVDELSAISANLGHITAGLIEAVTMIASTITGSLIQTAESGVYPRIQLDSTTKLLSAEYAAANTVQITPDAVTNNPGIKFDTGTVAASISNSSTPSGGIDALVIKSNPGFGHIQIFSGRDLILKAINSVIFDSWAAVKNASSSQTLQQALDAKLSTNGVSGTIPAGSSIFVQNGQIAGWV